MRTLKFRAWDKKKKEMTLNDSFYELQRWNRTQEELKCFEIMQFTGLLDKNGKEIYEGDIVKAHRFIEVLGANLGVCEGEEEDIRIIIYIEDNACFVLRMPDNGENKGWIQPLDCSDEGIEVIGNVFENPDLLKE